VCVLCVCVCVCVCVVVCVCVCVCETVAYFFESLDNCALHLEYSPFAVAQLDSFPAATKLTR